MIWHGRVKNKTQVGKLQLLPQLLNKVTITLASPNKLISFPAGTHALMSFQSSPVGVVQDVTGSTTNRVRPQEYEGQRLREERGWGSLRGCGSFPEAMTAVTATVEMWIPFLEADLWGGPSLFTNFRIQLFIKLSPQMNRLPLKITTSLWRLYLFLPTSVKKKPSLLKPNL
jgi:hypothetical protein